jgi:hypothetical protein
MSIGLFGLTAEQEIGLTRQNVADSSQHFKGKSVRNDEEPFSK